jgi:hypothetical protein
MAQAINRYGSMAKFRLFTLKLLLYMVSNSPKYNWKPLFDTGYAVGNFRLLGTLMKPYRGVYLIDQAKHGRVLQKALDSGNVENLKDLVDNSTLDVNMFDNAALKTALVMQNIPMIQYLLTRNANASSPSVQAVLATVNNPEIQRIMVEATEITECPVCFNECPKNSAKTCVEQKHEMCRACYENWRTTQESKNLPVNCPLCRGHLQLSHHEH